MMTAAQQNSIEPRTLWVRHPTGAYPVHIAAGLRHRLGEFLAERQYTRAAFLVTDENVAPLYADEIAHSLSEAGFPPHLIVLPPGEEHKTLATVRHLYDAFIARGIDRHTPVIALGGGVIGDTVGFAAATILRGVPFVQVPTTLLAMVDASVGGKTGVDLPQGKNLVGAFKFPDMVVMDVETLRTLPPTEFACGMAEVIKHGLIADPELLNMVDRAAQDLERLVARAVRVKIAVVEKDPHEQGRRAVLNLGHTFGHALERVAAYRLRHGFAVALGLVAAAHLGVLLGDAHRYLVEEVKTALRSAGLPTHWSDLEGMGAPPSAAAVFEAMQTDKKRRGKHLRFIVPREPGHVFIRAHVPEEMVLRALQTILENTEE